MRYIVSATNVPADKFKETPHQATLSAEYDAYALSKLNPGVSFTVFRVDDDGAVALSKYLNGKQTFKASDD